MVAPVMKMKYAVSVDTTVFKITDLTGGYGTANLGGYGGASGAQDVGPNWDLKNLALWAAVTRNASAGDESFSPDTVAVVTNPAAVNTAQTSIDFVNLNDGVLTIVFGCLKVSTDGINFLQDAGVIGEGEFFYWNNNGNQIWRMESAVPVVKTIVDLIGEASVPQTAATDIIEAKLAVTKQIMYKRYRISRDTDCEDANDLFLELQKLSQDIQGSYYAFYSGLTTEAQSQVETMLDRYQIVNT